MTDPGAILDYASPRKRGNLRLPSVSTLTSDVRGDAVLVEQRLAGKRQAVFGLFFGVITILSLLATTAKEVFVDQHWHLRSMYRWEILPVPAGIALLEIGVAVAVVQQTWRRTRLWAEFDLLKLDFISPLRNQHYVWHNDDILDVVLTITGAMETSLMLGEVMITRAVGGEVRLFTDHPSTVLVNVADAVRSVLRTGRATAK